MEIIKSWMKDKNLHEKEYQIEGIEWCLNNEINGFEIEEKIIKGGLIADEMGLGKTITMLSLLISNPKELSLIVLPKALLNQWEKIIITLTDDIPYIYHGNNIKKSLEEIMANHTIIITTYGMIATNEKRENKLFKKKWNRIIYDEAHHLRNKKTAIYKGAYILTQNSEINWLMSGTPIQNKKNDFYSLCDIIGIPKSFYMKTENLKELAKNFLIKRTKKDVNIEMPKINEKVVNVEWKNEDEKDISQIIHENLGFSNLVTRKNLRLNIPMPESKLALLIKAKQSCIMASMIKDSNIESNNSSKLSKVIETIVNSEKEKKKIVFCHFRAEIDEIYRKLSSNNYKTEIIDGRTNNSKRISILNNVKNIDVLILQIQTGCEGLNLQTFSEVYFVSPHWNPSIEEQAIARCHRIGQTEEVNIYRFIMGAHEPEQNSQSLEMHTKEVQKRKLKIADELN
jgi:SNF2 family DNA or RNA helicase